MFFVFRWLLKNDPELLERRMQMREREVAQRRIIGLSYLYFLLAFILPGLDKDSAGPMSLCWSCWPPIWSSCWAMASSSWFAGESIRVSHGAGGGGAAGYQQRAVCVGAPSDVSGRIADVPGFARWRLGSYWALLPALLIIPILVARILNEEKVLERDLAGYRDYEQATRYRLVPRIW